MTELDEILAMLVEDVDGAAAAAVAGMDGLLVEQYPPEDMDLAPVAAELTNVLSHARAGLSQLLDAGELSELVLRFDERLAFVRFLDRDIYCLIILDGEGNLGKARLCATKAAERLGQVLA